MDPNKLLQRLASGAVQNVSFSDFRRLLTAVGFELRRMQGSHHIFGHPDFPDLVNVQEVGGKAKPYQIRQVMKLIERYALRVVTKK